MINNVKLLIMAILIKYASYRDIFITVKYFQTRFCDFILFVLNVLSNIYKLITALTSILVVKT